MAELAGWIGWAGCGGWLTLMLARECAPSAPVGYGASILLFVCVSNLAWACMAPR